MAELQSEPESDLRKFITSQVEVAVKIISDNLRDQEWITTLYSTTKIEAISKIFSENIKEEVKREIDDIWMNEEIIEKVQVLKIKSSETAASYKAWRPETGNVEQQLRSKDMKYLKNLKEGLVTVVDRKEITNADLKRQVFDRRREANEALELCKQLELRLKTVAKDMSQ